MPIQPGTDIGRYHILEQLGEGGMAVVYKAYDTQLEREVALKVLRSGHGDNEKFIKRFKLEAKALAKLSHPNIVRILDFGEQDGLPYLVMEYISGKTLKQLIGKPMDYRKAAGLLAPIADALDYVHKQKILHRDVKPSNILIREDSTPLLSDFGIAKILELDETMDLTATGIGMGTPEYMAPEIANSKPVDQRADIYSLGIVLYELVTGRVPYRSDTPMAVLYKHINEPLVNPQKISREISTDFSRLILKALAKDPENRFDTAAEIRSALAKIAAGESITIQVQGFQSKKQNRIVIAFFILAVIGFFLISILLINRNRTSSLPTSLDNQIGKTPTLFSSSIPSPITMIESPVPIVIPKDLLICFLPDNSGINWGINRDISKSVEFAQYYFGVQTKVADPRTHDEYLSLLNDFYDEGCSIIFTHGYLTYDSTKQFAKNYPNQPIVALDNEWGVIDDPNNVKWTEYRRSEGTFLAGYLAAGMTKTGKIGIFTGFSSQAVDSFAFNFYNGIELYNENHNTDIELLGWGHSGLSGAQIGSFTDELKAYERAHTFIDQGVDIIFPIADEANSGVITAVEEYENCVMIGFDYDYAKVYPDSSNKILASVVLNFDDVILKSLDQIGKNQFNNSLYIGNLMNNAIQLVISPDWQQKIPLDLQNELNTIRQYIIDGIIQIKNY